MHPLRHVLLCLLALAPLGAGAQALPDTLMWEELDPGPLPFNADGITFDLDDRLVVATSTDALRWMPDGSWVRAFERRRQGRDYRFEPDGDIYYQRGSSLWRSRDDGETWREMGNRVEDPETWALTTPEGALLVGGSGVIQRSEDDSDTVAGWVRHDYYDEGLAETHNGLALLPPGTPGVPAGGRIVAVGITGVGYSDDDGRTWQPSELWCEGCIYAWNVTRLNGGPHAGALVVSLDDNRAGGVSAGVWRSADGVAWERVGRTFDDATAVDIYGLGDGVLVASRGSQSDLRVSEDGGATWREVGHVDPAHRHRLNDIERGPDGYLYAAITAAPNDVGGVYRTVDRIFAVAAEPASPSPASLGLAARPNPSSGGTVSVTLTQPSPAAVRVEVLDALGRHVAVLHNGVAGTEASFPTDTTALAPGVYLVRASTDSGTATLAFTVAR